MQTNNPQAPKIPAEIQDMIDNIKRAAGNAEVEISGVLIGPDGTATRLTLAPNGELVPDTSGEPVDLGMIGATAGSAGKGDTPSGVQEAVQDAMKRAALNAVRASAGEFMDRFASKLGMLTDAGAELIAEAKAQGNTEDAKRAEKSLMRASRMLDVVQLLRYSMTHDGDLPAKYETPERLTAAGAVVRKQVLDFLAKDGERHDAVLKKAADDYINGVTDSIETVVDHLHERGSRLELMQIFKASTSGATH